MPLAIFGLWAGDEAGLLVIDDLGLKRVLKKGLSWIGGAIGGGFEFIYPINTSGLFASETGFYILSTKDSNEPPVQLYFQK